METQQLKLILQAVLTAAGGPLTAEELRKLFSRDERPEVKTIRDALKEMMTDYEEQAIELKQLASGYTLQIRADYAAYVGRLWEEAPPRYSRALLETISIIAYRQPVTRAEIENIRGVAVSTSMVRTLLEREWIKVIGHRDVPGKPAIYGTTKAFLDYFNLKNLQELPTLQEIQDFDKAADQLGEQLQEIDVQQQELSLDQDHDLDQDEDLDETQIQEAEIESIEETEV